MSFAQGIRSVTSGSLVVRAAFLSVVLFFSFVAHAQLDDILKKADEALKQRHPAGLSNDKIIAGLKEALQVSTRKAVALTGKPDGFPILQ